MAKFAAPDAPIDANGPTFIGGDVPIVPIGPIAPVKRRLLGKARPAAIPPPPEAEAHEAEGIMADIFEDEKGDPALEAQHGAADPAAVAPLPGQPPPDAAEQLQLGVDLALPNLSFDHMIVGKLASMQVEAAIFQEAAQLMKGLGNIEVKIKSDKDSQKYPIDIEIGVKNPVFKQSDGDGPEITNFVLPLAGRVTTTQTGLGKCMPAYVLMGNQAFCDGGLSISLKASARAPLSHLQLA